MENKINLVELLKDCPKGMELDCVSYDNVSFDKISDDKKAIYPIFCYITDEKGNRSSISFTENGYESKRYGAKCVIFPKGKNTWEGFQRPFKDGDIIYNRLRKKICIYYLFEDEVPRIKGCRYNESNPRLQFEKLEYPIPIAIQDYRLATGEEQVKLFKAIENNGYKWNPETKTLEKLPKFKDGDILTYKNGNIFIYKGPMFYNKLLTDFYCGYRIFDEKFIPKLPNDKHFGDITECRLATEKEKAKLFQAINDNGYKWNAETKILEKLFSYSIGTKVWVKSDKEHRYIHTIVGISRNSFGNLEYEVRDEKTGVVVHYPESLLIPITTNEYRFKTGDRIKHKLTGLYCTLREYSEGISAYRTNIGLALTYEDLEQWELAPNKFDISKLKPFDKVLVRDFDSEVWDVDFFSRLLDGKHFKCLGSSYVQCIPYKSNEYLHNSTDACNNYFKTWE